MQLICSEEPQRNGTAVKTDTTPPLTKQEVNFHCEHCLDTVMVSGTITSLSDLNQVIRDAFNQVGLKLPSEMTIDVLIYNKYIHGHVYAYPTQLRHIPSYGGKVRVHMKGWITNVLLAMLFVICCLVAIYYLLHIK